MSLLEALILGIIQGLTEFLPVSSSGHLELGKVLLGIEPSSDVTFTVVVHGATVLSTIVVFNRDILNLLQGTLAFKWNESTDYVLKMGIAAIPVGVIGIFFKDQIELLFNNNVLLVGCMLLVTGSLLAFTYYSPKDGGEVTKTKAAIIGIAQAIAVMPGISRSGATIAVGILLGIDKKKVARFSFLIVLIPIIGAIVLDFFNGDIANSSIGALPLIIGFIAAFTSGVLACKWMITIVTRGKLIHFAIYCFIVGAAAIVGHYAI